eukprot:TRINITY_DN2325_c0_g1_i1.p1 TRINITY_DN2325_c0_g1~~TRINITY_DN2325_c0_g1_i1.p1  ORF type:complete len:236 (+),score=46.02 TRINITY_DN2325_c0_g1_i1:21-728(+)
MYTNQNPYGSQYGAPNPYGQQQPNPYGAPSPYGQPNPYQTAPPPANPYASQQGLTGWYAIYYNQVMQNPQVLAQVQQWFAAIDRDRSGNVSANELAGIQFNGRPLGIAVATKLVKVFDKDCSGEIDFKEYAALHQFLTTMQSVFFQADADRSGTIDAREIFPALTGAGFQLSFATVQACVAKFDTTRRGIDFPTFLYLCSHLAHLRSIFEWNDPQNTGRINLTYDALCHIGTDIL